jgi:hypothetical protein
VRRARPVTLGVSGGAPIGTAPHAPDAAPHAHDAEPHAHDAEPHGHDAEPHGPEAEPPANDAEPPRHSRQAYLLGMRGRNATLGWPTTRW